jgi:hypothetical protein
MATGLGVNGDEAQHVAGADFGPLPAKFDANTITFTETVGNSVVTYVLSRVTGILAIRWNDARDNHVTGYGKWTCHASKAQF